MEQEAERLVRQYGRLLAVIVRAVLGECGTPEDTEECVQDVLMEYLKKQDRLDETRGSEKTYLCVLARGRARSLRKRLSAHCAVPLGEELMLAAPDELARSGVRDALLRALEGLTEAERRLFTLRFVYEWDTRATARELGVSRTAVTTRTQRLREKLRRALARQGIGFENREGRVCTTE